MKKKGIAILLAVLMVISLFCFAACGGRKTDEKTPSGDGPVTPTTQDDLTFIDTEISVEAGEVGTIRISGSATRYMSTKPDVCTVEADGAGKLKVTALKEGNCNIKALDASGNAIKVPGTKDDARCRVNVTQKLILTMKDTAETAIGVPFAVPYTALGTGAAGATSFAVSVKDAAGNAIPETDATLEEGKAQSGLPTYTLTSRVEKDIVVEITATKSKTGETVKASTRISFVNFFQDKYYEEKYFRFEPTTETDHSKYADKLADYTFEDLPGEFRYQTNMQKSIDEYRAIIAESKGETPTPATPTPAAQTLAAAPAAQADEATGYTVYLSDGVLDGTIKLPTNFVIPATHAGKPVDKIGDEFMRAFAEYKGTTDYAIDPKDAFTAPYDGYKKIDDGGEGHGVGALYIPASVREIGVMAFAEVPMPAVLVQSGSGLQTIAPYAFHRCAVLTSFNLQTCTQLQTVGAYAFTNHRLTSVFIPKSVTKIGSGAFGQFANDGKYNSHYTLQTVEFEEDDDLSRAVVIYGGHGMTEPDQRAGAFAYNLGMRTLKLRNVKRVQGNAFAQAWGLEEVYIDAHTSAWALSMYKYDMTGYENYTYDEALDKATVAYTKHYTDADGDPVLQYKNASGNYADMNKLNAEEKTEHGVDAETPAWKFPNGEGGYTPVFARKDGNDYIGVDADGQRVQDVREKTVSVAKDQIGGGYAALDHAASWCGAWIWALNRDNRTTLTIDNAMIADVKPVTFANLPTDSHGLLGFDGAGCGRFGTLYVKEGIEPSAYVKEVYTKADTSDRDGYTQWTRKSGK